MNASLGLAHFWAQGDAVSHTVALALLLMSVWSWTVMLGKAWAQHVSEKVLQFRIFGWRDPGSQGIQLIQGGELSMQVGCISWDHLFRAIHDFFFVKLLTGVVIQDVIAGCLKRQTGVLFHFVIQAAAKAGAPVAQ